MTWPVTHEGLPGGFGWQSGLGGSHPADSGEPGLCCRGAEFAVDRECFCGDVCDGPPVAERLGELVLADPAGAHLSWLAVAETQQVAQAAGRRYRGQAGDVPCAPLIVEDVEQPAVDDRVEADAELPEVQRVGDLEPGRHASLGCFPARLRDGARRKVDTHDVRAVLGGQQRVFPGAAACVEYPAAEHAAVRQADERGLRPADVPWWRAAFDVYRVPVPWLRRHRYPPAGWSPDLLAVLR